MSASTRSWELGATLFSTFGALALVLALGLYSVLAFDVAQRTRELGVRVALGATRRRLMGDVIGRGLRVTAIGVVIGLMLAWLLAPRLAELLFGVSARDAVSDGGAGTARRVAGTTVGPAERRASASRIAWRVASRLSTPCSAPYLTGSS